MGRLRLPCDYSNSIDYLYPNANSAYSQILLVETPFNTELNKKQLVRSLLHFDISALTGNTSIPSSITATLVMYDAKPTNPKTSYDFTLNILPLTTSWVNGRGPDLNFKANETSSLSGAVNWNNRTTTNAWTVTGGLADTTTSYSGSVYFANGYENLSGDVTSLVSAWRNNTLSNNGFMLKLADVFEDLTGSNSAMYVYNKRFISNQSHTFLKPYIEIQWDDKIRDDRGKFEKGKTQYLTMSFMGANDFEELSGSSTAFQGTISLYEAGSTASLGSLTASRIQTGIYQASFTGYTGSQSTLYDVWSVTAQPGIAPVTGTINVLSNPLNPFHYPDKRIVLASNIRRNYQKGEKIYFHFTFSTMQYEMSLTAFRDAIDPQTKFYPKDAQLQIRDLLTGFIVYDYDDLSYDVNGFYRVIDTSNFAQNRTYVPYIKYTFGNQLVVDKMEDYKFFLR